MAYQARKQSEPSTKRNSALRTGLLASAVVLCACASGDHDDLVRTKVDPTADFTSFHTFAFSAVIPGQAVGAVSLPSSVASGLAVVDDAVRAELVDKGLTEVAPAQNPDLFVVSLASTEEQQALAWSCVPGYWWGYGWDDASWTPCAWLDPLYAEYAVGTVAIGLVHADAKSVPFGGLMQGVVDASGNATDRVDDDVHRMFKDYPEDQRGTGP